MTIATLLAFHLVLARPQPRPTVTYRGVPREVARIVVLAWQEDDAPPVAVVPQMVRAAGEAHLQGQPGLRSVVMFEREDSAYLIDGPFAWPDADQTRPLDRQWRRTHEGSSPAALSDKPPLEWLPVEEKNDSWPRCIWRDQLVWQCWGVTDGTSGILLTSSAGRVWWGFVSRGVETVFRSGVWGRLVRAASDGTAWSTMQVTIAQPVAPPFQRLRGIRLDTTRVANAHAEPVAPDVFWLYGEDVPPQAWVELRAPGLSTRFVPLDEVAAAPPALPLRVMLVQDRPLDGVVISAGGDPATGALLTIFRLIDPVPATGTSPRPLPRRVFGGETIASATGEFHFEGLAEADYEIVAWHSQLGRASVLLPKSGDLLTIRLTSPPLAHGRVISAGRPLAGVDIVSLPNPTAFNGAQDPIDAKGGDGTTGDDGRFAVMLSAAGGGELRVGGGRYQVRRIPLPASSAQGIDLGDIELGGPLEITLVLDRDPGCALRAIGPIGRPGLQIVTASQTGPRVFSVVLPEEGSWQFSLLCGGAERAVTPGIVQVTSGTAATEVHLVVGR